MNKRLYVKNLPFSVDDHRLQEKFAEIGQVDSAKVITNRDSGRSQGYGFVEMNKPEDAEKAVSQLNGQDFDGRSISVDFARPRENNGPRREGGGFGGPRREGGGGFGGGGGRGPRREGGGGFGGGGGRGPRREGGYGGGGGNRGGGFGGNHDE